MTRQATDPHTIRRFFLLAAALVAAPFAMAAAQSEPPPVPAYTDTLIYWPTEVAVEGEVIADTTEVEQRRLTSIAMKRSLPS